MAERVDLLVIGNGVAGNQAALTARRNAPEMSIMILGMEAHTEYAAPALPDYLSGSLPREKLFINTYETYAKNKIQIRLSEEAVDIKPAEKQVLCASGTVYEYDKLIIAAGSLPIRLNRMKGAGLPGNFVLKTIDDADALAACPGKRAVVVGSGAIGLEGAVALKARGWEKVSVVEALDWINMRSFDRETADEVVRALEKNGVETLSGESVLSVEGDTRVRAVRTSKRVIPCDLVLWGIGVRPRVELARQAGIALGELGGIAVDSHMRTSVPDIYACGDCTESADRMTGENALNLFWEPGARGGIAAGLNCAGVEKEFSGSIALFLTYIGETPVAAFGKTEKDLRGSRYQLLESRDRGAYRRILLQDGRIKGVQLVNTLECVNELLDQMQKEAKVDIGLLEQGDAGKYPALQLSLAAYIKQLRAASGTQGASTGALL